MQALIYPVTDLRAASGSYQEPPERQLLTAQTMRWFISHYLDKPEQCLDWRASPLLREDLRGLPPALVITAGFDPLRDEGQAYADRLGAAGVPVRHVCFVRQAHPFFTMSRVTGDASLAADLIAAALRRAWASAAS